MQKPRWSLVQVRALLDGVGGFGWQVLERRTGRTRRAITAKVFREFSGGGITRGSYSLKEICEETGYLPKQFKRAREALQQRWIRTARGGDFLIAPEQVDEMVAWLKNDYWSQKTKLYACTRCGTDSNPHYMHGLCYRCFRFIRYRLEKAGLSAVPQKLLDVTLQLEQTDAVIRSIAALERGQLPQWADLKKVIEIRRAG